MSINYVCLNCGRVFPVSRENFQKKRKEPHCPRCLCVQTEEIKPYFSEFSRKRREVRNT